LLKKYYKSLVFGIILLASIYLNSNITFGLVAKKGPNADEIQFIQYSNETVALDKVNAGDLDAYFFRIPLEAVKEIGSNQNIKVYNRTYTLFNLLMNPAPSNDNATLNPFQFKEIRYAMNYLINREYLVNNTFRSFAIPILSVYTPYSSPEYYNIADTIESFNFKHNPSLAEKIISNTLTSAGGKLENGKWFFRNTPITVKFLIRSDDIQRKHIGDFVSSELEKLGFNVEKIFGDKDMANELIYSSDPKDFKWNIYTDAINIDFAKYNLIAAYSYAPSFGRMPGWQNPVFWNYQNDTIDNAINQVYLGNITSEDERNALLRTATKAGIQESVRIFMVQILEPIAASSNLEGLINGVGEGIANRFSLINARSAINDSSLDIGLKQIYKDAWNNVGGFTDDVSHLIYAILSDPDIAAHPYTGEPIPIRLNWTDISTNGPYSSLKVDADAILWNQNKQQWLSVGENATAWSRVTYNITYSNWHNGIPMDKSDLLYSYYFPFALATKPGYTQLLPDLKSLKGIKFISNDQIVSFVDGWHYDKKQIALLAPVWAIEPWEITAATERIVNAKKLVYSVGEPAINRSQWLSLILPEHANMIKNELQTMKDEGFIPNALKGIITVDQAKKRYDASIQWITHHENAVIGNGPFYLDKFDPSHGIITIKAFRDQSYPLEQGYYSSFEALKLINR
jgi:peptide/nickel transport system substrate-binding protein